MNKKVKSFLSVLLVCTMMITSFTGCSKEEKKIGVDNNIIKDITDSAKSDSNVEELPGSSSVQNPAGVSAGVGENTSNEQTSETPAAPTPTPTPELKNLLGEVPIVDSTFTDKLNLFDKLLSEMFLYDVSVDDIHEAVYKAIVDSLNDKYADYYTADEFKEMLSAMTGNYCGIGAYVSQNIETKVITIVQPFEDGPAYKAGMKKGDIVVSVNGEDISGVALDVVVSKMKGEKGTKVIVGVKREGSDETIELTIIRDTILVPTISYEMREDNIGYIQLTQFYEGTYSEFTKALEKLKADGMTGLIIDLRDNPGGMLDSVIAVADYMLPSGIILYTKNKRGEIIESFKSDSKEFNIPLVILINENSASAAELFTAAMQDYNRATVVGTTSFGKGIVQTMYPLTDGSAIKFTIAEYYTLRGWCIQGIGVTPDVECPLDEELKSVNVITPDIDNQYKKAVEVLKEKIAETNK